MVQETILAVKDAESKGEQLLKDAADKGKALVERAKKEAEEMKNHTMKELKETSTQEAKAGEEETGRYLAESMKEAEKEITAMKQEVAGKSQMVIEKIIQDLI